MFIAVSERPKPQLESVFCCPCGRVRLLQWNLTPSAARLLPTQPARSQGLTTLEPLLSCRGTHWAGLVGDWNSCPGSTS